MSIFSRIYLSISNKGSSPLSAGVAKIIRLNKLMRAIRSPITKKFISLAPVIFSDFKGRLV